MAIQNRRGLMADFDPNKLLPGEFAFPLDTGEVFYCVAPGNVKRVATKEELQEILTSSPEAYTALQQLLSDLELNPSELTNILNNIASLQSGKLDKTGDSKDNTVTFTEAEEDENIESGEPHYTLFGKILKSIKTLRNSLTGKFDKANVVQSAEIDDEDKVASAAVTNGLANQVTQLNNNLANKNWISPAINTDYWTNGAGAEAIKYKIDATGRVSIVGKITSIGNGPVFVLPYGYRPPIEINVTVQAIGSDTVHKATITPDGNFYVFTYNGAWVPVGLSFYVNISFDAA